MLELVVERSSFTRSASGNVHASIHLVLDGRCFPDERWDDFAVVILGWWNEAVTRMALGFSPREELDFMDGPYSVHLELDPEGEITLRCLKSGARDVEEAVGRIALATFIQTLLGASRATLEVCKAHGWGGADFENLSDRVEVLERAAT